jgi:hypothetical protein
MADLPDPPAPPPQNPRSPTVTVRTVLECERESIVEALTLARSLRAFGGSQAQAACEIHFVERKPDDLALFAELGATVRVVERFDERCPHANKIRMLYPVQTDYLLAVDCDVVVAGDFTRFLVGEAVATATDWGDWMVEGRWDELFNSASIPFPHQRTITPRFWQETIHYPNSGVVVVPRRHVETLHGEWSMHVHELLDKAGERDWWGPKQSYFVDQIALGLANHSGRFPTRALPLEMNWLLKFDDLPSELGADERRPLLMHSIHRMDFETGHLLPHNYRGCREAIARYNALLEPVPEARLLEALRAFEETDRGW